MGNNCCSTIINHELRTVLRPQNQRCGKAEDCPAKGCQPLGPRASDLISDVGETELAHSGRGS